jgi:multidrug resistance efflux pump
MSRRRRAAVIGSVAVAALVVGVLWWRSSPDPLPSAVVTRGDLEEAIITTGVVRPAESMTYRSPIPGRETEILELAPEGSRVEAGELVVRFDTTELQRDYERAQQELSRLELDAQMAEGEWHDAEAALRTLTDGEGALSVEESQRGLTLAEKKVGRLRESLERLKPLLDQGYITRDELSRTAGDLAVAEEALALSRKRTEVLVSMSHPRERQRAQTKLVQAERRLETMRARADAARFQLNAVVNLIARCRLFAQRPGLVVYEELLTASPRRKIRIGDRVTASQGAVTIPEMDRLRVEASISEAELNRVRPGQVARVRLEAFPDLRLTGRVAAVGTMASAASDRPLDEKRFDLFIELDKPGVDLRPEMTARADIVVADRHDVLLIPVRAVTSDAGALVARVLGRSGVETRRLELGAASERFVEVLRGVAEHERVLLSDGGAPRGVEEGRTGRMAGGPP